MNAQAMLSQLFSGPAQLSLKSIVKRQPPLTKPQSFDTGNRFQALLNNDPPEEPKRSDMPIVADFKDFARPPRRNQRSKVKFAENYGRLWRIM